MDLRLDFREMAAARCQLILKAHDGNRVWAMLGPHLSESILKEFDFCAAVAMLFGQAFHSLCDNPHIRSLGQTPQVQD